MVDRGGFASTASVVSVRPPKNLGLHGHLLGVNVVKVAVAEATGTFLLVLSIVGTAVAATLSKPLAGPPFGSLAVPVAGGLALAAAVATLGPVSGAHLNPAVTVGLAVNSRFPWSYVPAYVAAQGAGAVGAALAAWWFYGEPARTKAGLGATVPASGVSAWRAFGVETAGTFVLLLAVVAIASDRRVHASLAALPIGLALSVAIIVAGPLTGAGINPARAIGPMIVNGTFTDWWVYLLAPLLGGILAVTFCERILRGAMLPGTAEHQPTPSSVES